MIYWVICTKGGRGPQIPTSQTQYVIVTQCAKKRKISNNADDEIFRTYLNFPNCYFEKVYYRLEYVSIFRNIMRYAPYSKQRLTACLVAKLPLFLWFGTIHLNVILLKLSNSTAGKNLLFILIFHLNAASLHSCSSLVGVSTHLKVANLVQKNK